MAECKWFCWCSVPVFTICALYLLYAHCVFLQFSNRVALNCILPVVVAFLASNRNSFCLFSVSVTFNKSNKKRKTIEIHNPFFFRTAFIHSCERAMCLHTWIWIKTMPSKKVKSCWVFFMIYLIDWKMHQECDKCVIQWNSMARHRNNLLVFFSFVFFQYIV